jgi:hypothetical protein
MQLSRKCLALTADRTALSFCLPCPSSPDARRWLVRAAGWLFCEALTQKGLASPDRPQHADLDGHRLHAGVYARVRRESDAVAQLLLLGSS